MGQVAGTIKVHPDAIPFMHLPRGRVIDLREAFHDVAEGFGLTLEEFQDIIRLSLKEYLDTSEIYSSYFDQKLNAMSQMLFELYHRGNERNNLVDSFEFICSICLLSGMSISEKLNFIFDLFDFDESGMISVEELTLMLRCCLLGLFKVCSVLPDPVGIPNDSELSRFCSIAFDPNISANLTEQYDGGRVFLPKKNFIEFASNVAEIRSWLDCLDTLEDLGVPVNNSIDLRSHRDYMGLDRRTITNIPSSDRYPSHYMRLKRVLGVNGYMTKNHVHYIPNSNDIVYPAGSICVKLDYNRHEQQFYNGHMDCVTCISVNDEREDGPIAASGELGSKPSIHIWSLTTMKMQNILKGFHQGGIQALSLSPNSIYLLSIGMDVMHSAAIYEWKKGLLLFTCHTSSNKIVDCSFSDTSKSFGVCGENFVSFWEQSVNNTFERRHGLFGSKLMNNRMTCITFFNEKFVTGSASGHLYTWEGRNCVAKYKGCHFGSIEVMNVISPILLGTGTSEATIQLWNKSFEIIRTLNMDYFGTCKRCINSLTWKHSTSSFIVSFQSNEIIEVDADLKVILVQGHFGGNFQGLATNPVDVKEFATAGCDGTVRIWKIYENMPLRMIQLDSAAGCISYSPHSKVLAVGLGCGSKRTKKDGSFCILCSGSLVVLHESRHSKLGLTDCKFTSDATILCFSSMDGSIYIHDGVTYSLYARTNRRSEAITSIDIGNLSGKFYIRGMIENNEISLWNCSGEQQSNKLINDVKWDTSSCSSIKCLFENSINDGLLSVSSCHTLVGFPLSIICDNLGRIHLSCHPVFQSSSSYICRGYGTKIGGSCFTGDGSSLITIGLDDCCVNIWEVNELTQQVINDLLVCEKSPILHANSHSFDRGLLWGDIVSEHFKALCNMETLSREMDFAPSYQWQNAIVSPCHDLEEDTTYPDHNLFLERIHGFNSYLSNNIYYGGTKNIIYTAANIVITLNVETGQQKFYKELKGQITCVAFNENRKICAIGQECGEHFIHVVDLYKNETIKVLRGDFSNRITNVKFDESGKYLATVGRDEVKNLAIYHWESGTIVQSYQAPEQETLAISFAPHLLGVVECGVGFIHFWEWSEAMYLKSAELGTIGKRQSFHAIAWIGNTPIVGTYDGHLYIFEKHELQRSVKAHVSTIHTMRSTVEGLISGSKDGCVKIWNNQLDCISSINMKTYSESFDVPCVTSIDWDIKNHCIIAGLSTNEIWEFKFDQTYSDSNCQLLMKGVDHSSNGKALAVHPKDGRFITAGCNKSLLLWNIRDTLPIKTIELESFALCASFSPCGQMVAVGLGSPPASTQSLLTGKWIIMNDENYDIIFEARDSVKPVSEIKWSPNGESLAVGSWDANIYIYTLQDNSVCRFQNIHVLSKHNSIISNIDFSSNGMYLRSNCDAYELYYWDLRKGLGIKSHSYIRDTEWYTHNCSLSWASQGVWSRENDGTKITSIDYNARGNAGDRVLVAGDNYGRVRLFRYPCLSCHYLCKVYRGHNGAVSSIRWIGAGSYLVTVGQYDNAIFIYRREVDDEAILDTTSQQGKRSTNFTGLEMVRNLPVYKDKSSSSGIYGRPSTSRPWLSKVVQPSIPSGNASTHNKSQTDLELHHIFGMNSSLSDIIALNSHGDVLFPVSSNCAIVHSSSRSQTFYQEHTSFISCLSIAPNRLIVATGEVKSEPSIMLWNANTYTTISCISKYHWNSILCVEFSADSKSLLSIGNEHDHFMIVWRSPSSRWDDWYLQARVRCGIEHIYFARFLDINNSFDIVTGGKNHIKFWNITGCNMHASKALFQGKGYDCEMLCGCIFQHMFVTGTDDGHIYAWIGRSLVHVHTVSSDPVTSLFSCGEYLWVGSCGVITQWTLSFQKVQTFTFQSPNPITSLVSIARDKSAYLQSLIVANSAGNIYKLSVASGRYLLFHESHCGGDIQGLSTHPLRDERIATCGDDGVLRIWDLGKFLVIDKFQSSYALHCVAWSTNGLTLIVSYGKRLNSASDEDDTQGMFVVMNAETMKVIFEGKAGDHQITDIKFSPDNRKIAFGLTNGYISIHLNDINANFKQVSCSKQHSGCINSIDFSSDSIFIRSCSYSDYDLTYFNIVDDESIRLPSLTKNISWVSQNCVFGWNVQGVWGSLHDEPSCMDRSNDNSLLAVGDFNGLVKLYNFPVVSNMMDYKSNLGHVGKVSNCLFTCGDNFLISIGQYDRSIYIWKVLK